MDLEMYQNYTANPREIVIQNISSMSFKAGNIIYLLQDLQENNGIYSGKQTQGFFHTVPLEVGEILFKEWHRLLNIKEKKASVPDSGGETMTTVFRGYPVFLFDYGRDTNRINENYDKGIINPLFIKLFSLISEEKPRIVEDDDLRDIEKMEEDFWEGVARHWKNWDSKTRNFKIYHTEVLCDLFNPYFNEIVRAQS